MKVNLMRGFQKALQKKKNFSKSILTKEEMQEFQLQEMKLIKMLKKEFFCKILITNGEVTCNILNS